MIQMRQVEGTDYEVDSNGRVYSPVTKRPMKPVLNGPTGYLRLNLTVNRDPQIRRTRYVHHLVAAAFIGPRPEGLFINHKNGNKLDNRASNLEYCTRKENVTHAMSLGLIKRGESQGNAKLNQSQVNAIRLRQKDGLSHRQIGNEFGIAHSTVGRIIRGEIWR